LIQVSFRDQSPHCRLRQGPGIWHRAIALVLWIAAYRPSWVGAFRSAPRQGRSPCLPSRWPRSPRTPEGRTYARGRAIVGNFRVSSVARETRRFIALLVPTLGLEPRACWLRIRWQGITGR